MIKITPFKKIVNNFTGRFKKRVLLHEVPHLERSQTFKVLSKGNLFCRKLKSLTFSICMLTANNVSIDPHEIHLLH